MICMLIMILLFTTMSSFYLTICVFKNSRDRYCNHIPLSLESKLKIAFIRLLAATVDGTCLIIFH